MQSSKTSKKPLTKGEESVAEPVPVKETKGTRSARAPKATKETTETMSAKSHRKSPTTSSLRADGKSTPSKVMTAAAGAGTGTSTGSIIDSVGVVAASPSSEASNLLTSQMPSRPAPSREEIAHLAYSYWAARGFTHGLSDEDWLRAEAELLGKG